MKITLVAAMAQGRVIGKDNQMPWHMPADLRHFKALTLHKPVIMGRHTFESLGKPLPQRRNIVLTRDQQAHLVGCEIARDLPTALAMTADAEDIIIMGGAQLYSAALPVATHMHLTFIDAAIAGDTYFPEWNPAEWHEVDRQAHPADDKNPYPYTFVSFQRHISS